MFDNIGKKLKGFAVASTCLGIVCSLIYGVVLFAISPFLSAIVILAGALISWCGSFTLYGLGHLIEVVESAAYYEKHSFQKMHNIDEKLDRIVNQRNNEGQ